MEKSTPVGIVAGFALIFGTIFMGDGWTTFFDVGSIIMVLGGTVAALMVSFSIADLKIALVEVKHLFNFQEPELSGYVAEFSELSRTARREGLLALDRRLAEIDDEFMKFGLELAVDGIEEAEINDLLVGRMTNDAGDKKTLVSFLNNAGTFCPAFGMVGTLIGLIQMMQNLTDPSAIGAGMAVAMITTFYDMVSNLVLLPAAAKAKAQLGSELTARQVVRAGVMGIVRGESPSMIEKRLQLYLKEIDDNGGTAPPVMKQAA